MNTRSVAVVALALLASCAYPRRSTPLSPAPHGPEIQAPNGVLRIQFQSAEIPAQDRGGRPWDEDGSPPDTFIRIYRDGDLVFESATIENSLRPAYNVTTPNLHLPRASNTRIEVWESDALRLPSIVGSWTGRGLPPGALQDADASLTLEGRAVLHFRVLDAESAHGMGIVEYELRSDRLIVLEVLRFSPAGRADIRAGDAIIEIAERSVRDMSNDEAAGALSMASSRRSSIKLERDGQVREVEIDGLHTWLIR